MVAHHHPAPDKYKLSVDDFLRLDETGVFGADRTELVDGEVIAMNAEYRPHGWIAEELRYRFRRALEALGGDLYVMSASVAVSDHDLPLPDIVLTREPRGPGPIPLPSVAMIVEVAASTLRRDMNDKLPMYARAKLPEYWIVDADAGVVHRFWSPTEDQFATHEQVRLGEMIASATIKGLTIDTPSL